MSLFAKTVLCLSLVCCATSCCYRMPDADEYSLVPSTNNPSYTKETASQMPSVGY